MMTLNDWVREVHELAKLKGWHEKPRAPLEIHMLIVSEVAEATECVRASEPALHFGAVSPPPHPSAGFKTEVVGDKTYLLQPWERLERTKPCGEAIELADAVIRIMDYFGARGWDLEAAVAGKHDYNQTRSYRHGGKTV